MNGANAALTALGRLRLAAAPSSAVDRTAFFNTGWRRGAERLGLRFVDLGSGFQEIHGAQRSVRVHESCVSVDNMISFSLVGNKVVSSKLLGAAGLPLAPEKAYSAASSALRSRLRQEGSKLVVKPASDTGAGRGITVGPTGIRPIGEAIVDAATFGPQVLLQDRVEGRVVRVLVADGEVLDAVERRPAAVTGDGMSTIKQLVEAENERRGALGDQSTGFIATGADFRAALFRQELAPKRVPRPGESIVVSGRSNSGSERESWRIELSKTAERTAIQAAAAVGVVLAGVDLIVNDVDEVLAVLEVNTCPGLHWHVLVAENAAPIFEMVLSRFVGSP